jgi:hypothetical protein
MVEMLKLLIKQGWVQKGEVDECSAVRGRLLGSWHNFQLSITPPQNYPADEAT